MFTVCVGLVFCSKYVPFHIIWSLQYNININTVEVDPHSDLLHICIVKPKNISHDIYLYILVPDGAVASEILKDSHLNDISEDLGRDWKALGRKLEIESTILDNIDAEYRWVKEKSFQMMLRWKKRSGNNATGQALANALIARSRRDIAEKLAGTVWA